jgi:hypothetical protein
MKTMKKYIKIINKNIPFANNLRLYALDHNTNKNDEENRSFDFTSFYTKFSEVYPDKEIPDPQFLE